MQDRPSVATLSELEGAVLSELHHRGAQTAFKVRRSFATSPSLEWRGSAGSVYAAIRRLETAGLIAAENLADARGSRLLSITGQGVEALRAWAWDLARAVSVGVDPFRLRSGIWASAPADDRDALSAELEAALVSDIEALKAFRRHEDALETTSVDLAVRLQQARLEWLRATRLKPS